jgi:hypothetical protein
VIVAPGTRAESIIAFAAEKNPCAQLVKWRWVTDSMAYGKLLDPARYLVTTAERAELLRGKW